MRAKKLHPLLEAKLRKIEGDAANELRRLQFNFAEKAPAGIGVLTIVRTDAVTGRVIDVSSGENIVVNLGRSSLAHLLAGDSVDNHKVVGMRFGDGATAPTVNDTGLAGALIIEKSTTYDFPDGDSGLKVRFTAVVGADEGNGSGSQEYKEACLVKGNGDIFSRKVSGTITKDNTVVLTAIWTYIF